MMTASRLLALLLAAPRARPLLVVAALVAPSALAQDASAPPSGDAAASAEASAPAAADDDATEATSPSATEDDDEKGAPAAAPEGATDGEAAASAPAAGTAAPDAASPLVDAAVDRFRTPVDRLTEHYLGSTARPVRFDWRRSLFMLGVEGGELVERNNFGSFRIGAVVRKAFFSLMLEGAANYVFVLGTESSELLALTPYRQAARPPRVELDVNVSYPLFEGVVTPLFDWVPASEMVFAVTGGARYLLYPQVIIGERDWESTRTWTDTTVWQDIGASLATPQLLDDDRRLLERRGLPGMSIDPATVHTLGGVTVDAYYQPGLFLSFRALLNIPAIAAVSGTRLGFWWELSATAGWAF